jgi:hypothetical protein
MASHILPSTIQTYSALRSIPIDWFFQPTLSGAATSSHNQLTIRRLEDNTLKSALRHA